MKLIDALRCNKTTCMAFVGSGGKSSAIFQLAKEYASPVIISASTHLAEEQARKFYKHHIVENYKQLEHILNKPLLESLILTGSYTSDKRTHGLSFELLEKIRDYCKESAIPFLIEADGSRKLPLKAPANHEPAVPTWVDLVVVTAGMDSLGQTIDQHHVHRPEILTNITGTNNGDVLDDRIIGNLLGSPQGGLKNIPEHADRKLLLNQVNTNDRRKASIQIAVKLVDLYSSVIIADIPHWDLGVLVDSARDPVLERREKIAGIILAAGGAERFGGPKILQDWGGIPIIRQVALNAINSGLSPVILVLGAYTREVIPSVQDLPINIVGNLNWANGQSTSFKEGVHAVPNYAGGFVVLLGDQPQVPSRVVRQLIRSHQLHASPIIIPVVDGKRANPVLFDIGTRELINSIDGDTGGRAIFKHFPVTELLFEDPGLTDDIDTVEDYHRIYDKFFRSTNGEGV